MSLWPKRYSIGDIYENLHGSLSMSTKCSLCFWHIFTWRLIPPSFLHIVFIWETPNLFWSHQCLSLLFLVFVRISILVIATAKAKEQNRGGEMDLHFRSPPLKYVSRLLKWFYNRDRFTQGHLSSHLLSLYYLLRYIHTILLRSTC